MHLVLGQAEVAGTDVLLGDGEVFEKWFFGMGTDNMVTNGGLQIHLQMAPLVSKHRGAPQLTAVPLLFLFAQAAQAQWTPAKRLTWTSDSSSFPAIAIDISGNLHMVWEDITPGDYEIYYKKSTDGEGTWTPSRRLTSNSGDSWWPNIAIDPFGSLFVIWCDETPGNMEIYYRKSTDEGATWTPSKRITWTSGDSFAPSLAIDSFGNLHVVWNDISSGSWAIYYTKSADGGATWITSKRITWTLAGAGPAVDTDSSGTLHVVWYSLENAEVYYKKSTDEGATWRPAKRLTWTSGQSWSTAIAVDSLGNIHLTWTDNTPGNNEIYYRKSMDGGDSWAPSMRITWTSGWSGWPAIGSDLSDNLHVVWEDDTPGNEEIYYRRYIN